MRECWLKQNQRVYLVPLAIYSTLPLLGMVCVVLGILEGKPVMAIGAGVGIASSLWFIAICYRRLQIPRLAYEDGNLYIKYGRAEPIRVPIDIVEVFFLGSGPALSNDPEAPGPRTANVVIRLAETATDWHNGHDGRDLPTWAGKWFDGYIVLRGTWCEPIGHERLNEMNHRLAEVRRQRRQASQQPQQATS